MEQTHPDTRTEPRRTAYEARSGVLARPHPVTRPKIRPSSNKDCHSGHLPVLRLNGLSPPPMSMFAITRRFTNHTYQVPTAHHAQTISEHIWPENVSNVLPPAKTRLSSTSRRQTWTEKRLQQCVHRGKLSSRAPNTSRSSGCKSHPIAAPPQHPFSHFGSNIPLHEVPRLHDSQTHNAEVPSTLLLTLFSLRGLADGFVAGFSES